MSVEVTNLYIVVSALIVKDWRVEVGQCAEDGADLGVHRQMILENVIDTKSVVCGHGLVSGSQISDGTLDKRRTRSMLIACHPKGVAVG